MFDKNQPQKEEEKKEETKQIPPTAQQPKIRQIILETDGNGVKVVKAEVSGNLELSAILSVILKNLK